MKFNKSSKKSKAKTEGVIIGTGRSFRWTKKQLLATALVVLLAIAGILIYKQFFIEQTETAKQQNLCSKELEQGSVYFNAADHNNLKPIVDRVNATEDHQESMQCMYILTVYDVNIGDAVGARANFATLESLYQINGGYSEELAKVAKSLEVLKSSVEYVEKQAEDLRKNSFFGPEVK